MDEPAYGTLRESGAYAGQQDVHGTDWSIGMIDRTEEGLEAITAKIDELEALLVKLNEQRREIINYLGTNKK